MLLAIYYIHSLLWITRQSTFKIFSAFPRAGNIIGNDMLLLQKKNLQDFSLVMSSITYSVSIDKISFSESPDFP